MDRATLLRHLRVTHFESGDRDRARADARRIAAYLAEQGASRVVGIGSAFERTRSFTDRSDIDLVVEGIEPRRYYTVSARAAAMTDFTLDLTRLRTRRPRSGAASSRTGSICEAGGGSRASAGRRDRIELVALAALGEEFANAPKGDDTYSVRARGSILHDFYNGVERVFLRIAPELNGGVPRGDQWHRELIRDMALTLHEVRPAVIDDRLAEVLGEHLRFRHVFRNVYGGVLDAQRMASLEMRLPETLTAFRQRIEGFVRWMLGR